MSENIKKGGISVESAQIFPVIKKWLYSDKEIFIREIISNAADACTKLKRLSSLGEVKDIEGDYRIDVSVDREARTITVSDNGIGMTADEVERYIGNIALSGALEFIEKYEAESTDSGIIGHFGLGFYSAFMVCDTIELITRSYTAQDTVKWVCDDQGGYEMSDTDVREVRGTDVILHINDEGEEYLDAHTLRSAIEKYCAFMPVPIFFTDDGCECESECEHKNVQINDTAPLWQKQASECTDEEYKEFYKKVFDDMREPLFWIHINADYPLDFKGILYFPNLSHEFDNLEGRVKLYYNQVFVADNIKEVIPEYMLMLRGALDCPQLPLNVSRSYLQSNGYVKKVSAHIVKKVADKINGMFNTDRENYEKLWQSIKLFTEYAALCDKKFYERVRASLLLPLTDGSCKTLDEYLEASKDKQPGVVYYATDTTAQAQYVSILESEGILCAVFDKMIDTQFISLLESENENVKFKRVDSDITSVLKSSDEGEERENLTALFREAAKDEKLKVKCEHLGERDLAAVLTLDEQTRRFDDMMKMYKSQAPEGMGDVSMAERTLSLNLDSPVITRLDTDTPTEKDKETARYVYMLALLSQRNLTAEELNEFLAAGYRIISDAQ